MDRADLKRFQREEFDPVEYVDVISTKLVYELSSRDERIAADPKTSGAIELFDTGPFLELFQGTLDQLKQLQIKVDKDIVQLVKECEVEEEEHKRKMTLQTKVFEKNFVEFKDLDVRVCSISNSAVGIGKRLEAVVKQRNRAAEVEELVNYFIELNAGEPRSEIFTNDTMLKERARLLKRLINLTQEIERAEEEVKAALTEQMLAAEKEGRDGAEEMGEGEMMRIVELIKTNEGLLQRTKRGKETVEAQSNKLENLLLQKFDTAMTKEDHQTMKECAEILYEYNGGSSVVRHYITQLKMFFDTASLRSDEALADAGRKSGKVETASAKIDSFFSDVSYSVQREHKLIRSVFPNSSLVMQNLVQRIFEQRIGMFLELILSHNDRLDSLLMYLQLLVLCYSKTKTFALSLAQYDLADMNCNILIDSLFTPYKEDYTKKEMAYLTAAYEDELKTLREQQRAEEAKKAQGSAFAYAGEALREFTKGKDTITMQTVPDLNSLEPILFFIHTNEEAARRCAALAPKDDVKSVCFRIFELLITYLGSKYIIPALEGTVQPLVAVSTQWSDWGGVVGIGIHSDMPKAVQFLQITQQVNHVVILLQRHLHKEILPHVPVTTVMYTQCIEYKNTLLAGIEEKISLGLRHTLDIIVTTFARQLTAEQGRNDFRVNDESLTAIDKPTAACANAVKFVNTQASVIRTNLDGNNAILFLKELGTFAAQILLVHYQRYYIYQIPGALKWKRDIQEFKTCLTALFPAGESGDVFDVLAALNALHFVEPDKMHDMLLEPPLSSLSKDEILKYIKLRSDFKSAWIQQYHLLD